MPLKFNTCRSPIINDRGNLFISFFNFENTNNKNGFIGFRIFHYFFLYKEYTEFPVLTKFEWNFGGSIVAVSGEWDSFQRFFPLTTSYNQIHIYIYVHLYPGKYKYRFYQNNRWTLSGDLGLTGFGNEAYHEEDTQRYNKFFQVKTSTLDLPSFLDLGDLRAVNEKIVYFYPYKGITYTPPMYFKFVRENLPKIEKFWTNKYLHHDICLSFYVYLNHIFFFSWSKLNEILYPKIPTLWVRLKEKNFNLIFLNEYEKTMKYSEKHFAIDPNRCFSLEKYETKLLIFSSYYFAPKFFKPDPNDMAYIPRLHFIIFWENERIRMFSHRGNQCFSFKGCVPVEINAVSRILDKNETKDPYYERDQSRPGLNYITKIKKIPEKKRQRYTRFLRKNSPLSQYAYKERIKKTFFGNPKNRWIVRCEKKCYCKSSVVVHPHTYHFKYGF
ncbi:AMP-activated protein kinase, beta 2 (nucleomorph) [Chroomonas mesostigmatica CCMP1168]|uniref:AMP-activated protein kinase, beta 2 n=1 Tax=Chroomonas mesostigmatica CCMP1168 TaxID=1195612 RepID=J7G9Q3_9CRYP|nr:AMP-activated protein kinase, beta 2 [Chroomonas mesostigmatica CCMP1168]